MSSPCRVCGPLCRCRPLRPSRPTPRVTRPQVGSRPTPMFSMLSPPPFSPLSSPAVFQLFSVKSPPIVRCAPQLSRHRTRRSVAAPRWRCRGSVPAALLAQITRIPGISSLYPTPAIRNLSRALSIGGPIPLLAITRTARPIAEPVVMWNRDWKVMMRPLPTAGWVPF